MSTETLGWLVGARDGKKLGSSWDQVNYIPTLSQPGLFQTFPVYALGPLKFIYNIFHKNWQNFPIVSIIIHKPVMTICFRLVSVWSNPGKGYIKGVYLYKHRQDENLNLKRFNDKTLNQNKYLII